MEPTNKKDEIICQISDDIMEKKITTFKDLIEMVKKKYGDNGIIAVSVKTSFFKELVESNQLSLPER